MSRSDVTLVTMYCYGYSPGSSTSLWRGACCRCACPPTWSSAPPAHTSPHWPAAQTSLPENDGPPTGALLLTRRPAPKCRLISHWSPDQRGWTEAKNTAAFHQLVRWKTIGPKRNIPKLIKIGIIVPKFQNQYGFCYHFSFFFFTRTKPNIGCSVVAGTGYRT